MLYIHRTTCISPQQTFPETELDLSQLYTSSDNKLKAREPSYEGIPSGQLRRMGKTVRLGIGAALPLLREAASPPDGILIGTANAGMEESIRFMKEIIEHDEGILAPGSFVQSTPNTIAAQLSLLSRNKGYNITHVQGGLAFEYALIDAAMLLKEHASLTRPAYPSAGPDRSSTYIVGGADEIGTHNYNIDRLQGWFKKDPVSNTELYASDTPGSLAGEGAAVFLVSDRKEDALARLVALTTLHSDDPGVVGSRLQAFLDQVLAPGEKIDLLLSGENGDNRFRSFFETCERVLTAAAKPNVFASPDDIPSIARFKHLCGEYPTASAFGLWLACQLLGNRPIPGHLQKRSSGRTIRERILIYNNHKGRQHSFMLVTLPG